MNINAEINTRFEGKFKIAVVKKDGTIRYPMGQGWHKNLILDSGVNLFFNANRFALPQIMDFCRAGTGTTAAVVTNTVLQAQVRFSNTYNVGIGNNSTTFNNGTGAGTFQRVYEFLSEVGTVVYGELGMSNTSGGNLFSRFVLSPGVSVAAGENLRVTYALTLTVPQIITGTPTALTSGTFDAAGTIKVAGPMANLFPNILANGGTPEAYIATLYNGSLIPYSVAFAQPKSMQCTLRTGSAFPAVNALISPGSLLSQTFNAAAVGVTVINTPYVDGTFTKTGTFIFLASNPGSTITTIRSIILCYNNDFGDPTANGYGIMLLLDAAQTKGADFSLTLTFRWTVTRP